MAGNECDVCRRTDLPTHVASSSIGAVSWAYCTECIKHYANPELEFHYLYDWVSTDGAGLIEQVNDYVTYKDGKYITWIEWKAWRQHPDNKTRLDKLKEDEIDALTKMS